MKKRFKPRRDYGSRKTISEAGTIIKKGKGLIKTALVYPNTYKAGMSSLGYQTIYKLANKIEFVSCERVFWQRQKDNTRCPKSIETGLSLNKFDIIMFSISFENDFLNLAQLLVQSGIPLRSSDRNHIHPLVVAGGIACFLNPEPIAAFIDCFLLGEAECLLRPFFDNFVKKPNKNFFLKDLEQQVPGAYVPCKNLETENNKIKHIKVQYLDTLETTTSCTTILASDTVFKDTFLIETLKGCPHGCRFCSAGFIYRPPRIYPTKNIYNAINKAIGKTDKIGLVSSAIADHPDIMDICDYALKHKFRLSFSSLRADKLNKKFILALSDSKVKTATLAPEAGSKRMRKIINKNIDETDILFAVKKLINAKIINLKLYFMIGLPFEEMEDIHAIVELTKKIKLVFLEESKKNKRIGTITLSINPFIPKPCTPFQWTVMENEKILKKKVKIIRHSLKEIANLNINVESIKNAKIHAFLSRGDQNTAEVIESALKDGWASAIRKNKKYFNLIVYEKRDIHNPLPWDFIDTKVDKSFLINEFLKAKNAKQSASCPMINCNKCQTCI